MTTETTRLTQDVPLAFRIGLPLLAVVVYSDVSDILIRNFSIPSVLQLLIVLLLVAVWRHRQVALPLGPMMQPLVILFALYAMVIFSTSIWSKEAARVDARFSEVAKAIIICVLVGSMVVSRQLLRRALEALVCTAAALSALSVVQVTTGRLENAFGVVQLVTGTIYGRVVLPRAAGPPVSDPNFYARILLIVIPIAIGLAITAPTFRRRLFFTAAAALIATGTVVTYSRGAMLTLMAMGAMLVIGFRVPARRVAVLAVIAIIGIAALPENVAQRLLTIETLLPERSGMQLYDSSVIDRKMQVASGARMFADRPLTGVGAGHYGRYYTAYANEVGSPWIDWDSAGSEEFPHGLHIEVASETGLLGLLTFGAAITAAFVTLSRSRRVLLASGDHNTATIALVLGMALASYLAASFFLHETHLRYVGLYFGFVIAVARLASSRQPELA